jgi:hypothetical protein
MGKYTQAIQQFVNNNKSNQYLVTAYAPDMQHTNYYVSEDATVLADELENLLTSNLLTPCVLAVEMPLPFNGSLDDVVLVCSTPDNSHVEIYLAEDGTDENLPAELLKRAPAGAELTSMKFTAWKNL